MNNRKDFYDNAEAIDAILRYIQVAKDVDLNAYTLLSPGGPALLVKMSIGCWSKKEQKPMTLESSNIYKLRELFWLRSPATHLANRISIQAETLQNSAAAHASTGVASKILP